MTILKSNKKRARLALLALGVFFILLGLYLSPKTTAKPIQEATKIDSQDTRSFSQEPVNIDKKLLTLGKNKTGRIVPTRIIIPGLSIDTAVKEAKVVKGYWEVFTDSAGFGEGTASLDEIGNTVIFAHAKPGLFFNLNDAKIGQSIYVLGKDKWESYKITHKQDVFPSQIQSIAPTGESILTLYTCTGFADSKRLIIQAKKQ